MPYIRPERRCELEIPKGVLGLGDMSYIIWQMLKQYKRDMGESYHTHTAILGMLESLKQEWYRIETASYEEEKREQNGDC